MSEPSRNWLPNLAKAIDRNPLIVPPTLPLSEAIALISQSRYPACDLTEDLGRSIAVTHAAQADSEQDLEQDSDSNSEFHALTSAENPSAKATRTSCMLVVQDRKLLGILTERDIVGITAKAIDITAKTVAEVMVHPVITLPQSSIHDIFATLFLFRRYRIRHLPIVDGQNELIGVISHESVRQILRPANLLRLRRVADVMVTQVVQAPLTTPLLALAQQMAEHRVSCVVLTQPDEADIAQPVGIITERDIVQFQAFQLDFQNTPAHLVMSTPLFLLHPNDSLWTAHQEMQQRRVGRLVVSWNWGQGLGIVTQTSLLRIFDPIEMYRMIENLQQTIKQQTIEQQTIEQQISEPLTEPLNPPCLTIAPDPLPSIAHSHSPTQLTPVQLTSIHSTIQHLLNHPHLAIDQQRSLLQSVLETLEKALPQSIG